MVELETQEISSTEGKVDEKPSSFLSKCFEACKHPTRGCCVIVIVAIVLCVIGIVAGLIVRSQIFSSHCSENKKDQTTEKPAQNCPLSSFNFPRHYKTSDYARYRGEVPRLTRGTVCMWLYARDLSHDFGIFSYALSRKKHNHFLLAYDYINSVIDFHFDDRRTGSVQENVSLSLNSKAHICAWFDSSSKLLGLYINGRSTGPMPYDSDVLIGGGSLILAQDQDEFGGGFDPVQAMTGTVENAVIWPRVLDEFEIQKMALNCVCPSGHVIALAADNMELFGEAVYSTPDSCLVLP